MDKKAIAIAVLALVAYGIGSSAGRAAHFGILRSGGPMVINTKGNDAEFDRLGDTLGESVNAAAAEVDDLDLDADFGGSDLDVSFSVLPGDDVVVNGRHWRDMSMEEKARVKEQIRSDVRQARENMREEIERQRSGWREQRAEWLTQRNRIREQWHSKT